MSFCKPFLGPPISNNTLVRVVGLKSRADLNGRCGKCIGKTSTGRYKIQIEGEAEAKSLKLANVVRRRCVDQDTDYSILFSDAVWEAQQKMLQVGSAVQVVDEKLGLDDADSNGAQLFEQLKAAIKVMKIAENGGVATPLTVEPAAVHLLARHACIAIARIAQVVEEEDHQETQRFCALEYRAQWTESTGPLTAEERSMLYLSPPEADGVIRNPGDVARSVLRSNLYGSGESNVNQQIAKLLMPKGLFTGTTLTKNVWSEWVQSVRDQHSSGGATGGGCPIVRLEPALIGELLDAIRVAAAALPQYGNDGLQFQAQFEGEALEAVSLIVEQNIGRVAALALMAGTGELLAGQPWTLAAAGVSATVRGTSEAWQVKDEAHRNMLRAVIGDIDFPIVNTYQKGADPTLRPAHNELVEGKSGSIATLDDRFDQIVGDEALAAYIALAGTHGSSGSGYLGLLRERKDHWSGIDGAARDILNAVAPFPRPLSDVPRRLARLRAGGELRLHLGDIVGAISHFRCATALSRHDWKALEGLARAKCSLQVEYGISPTMVQQNVASAQQDCERLLKLAPESALAQYTAALVLVQLYTHTEDVDFLQRALGKFIQAVTLSAPAEVLAKMMMFAETKMMEAKKQGKTVQGKAALLAGTAQEAKDLRREAARRGEAMRAREDKARAAEEMLRSASEGDDEYAQIRTVALVARAEADADTFGAAEMPPMLTPRSSRDEIHSIACAGLARWVCEMPPSVTFDETLGSWSDSEPSSHTLDKHHTLSETPLGKAYQWFLNDRVDHGDEPGAGGGGSLPLRRAFARLAINDVSRHARRGPRVSGRMHVMSKRFIILSANSAWRGGMALARAQTALENGTRDLQQRAARHNTNPAWVMATFPSTRDDDGQLHRSYVLLCEALLVDRRTCALRAARERGADPRVEPAKLPPLRESSEYSTPIHDQGGTSGTVAIEWIRFSADGTLRGLCYDLRNSTPGGPFPADFVSRPFVTGGAKFGNGVCPPCSDWAFNMARSGALQIGFTRECDGGLGEFVPARVAAQELCDRYYKGGARWSSEEGALRQIISFAARASLLHAFSLLVLHQMDLAKRCLDWGCDFMASLDRDLAPELALVPQRGTREQPLAGPSMRGAVFEPSMMRGLYMMQADLVCRLVSNRVQSGNEDTDITMKRMVLKLRVLQSLERSAHDVFVTRRKVESGVIRGMPNDVLHSLDWEREGGRPHAMYFTTPLAATAAAFGSLAHKYESMLTSKKTGYRNIFSALARIETRAAYADGEMHERGGVGLSSVIEWTLDGAANGSTPMALQFVLGGFPLTLSLGRLKGNGITEGSRMNSNAVAAMWYRVAAEMEFDDAPAKATYWWATACTMIKSGPYRDDDVEAGRGRYTVGELKTAVENAHVAMATRDASLFGASSAHENASLRYNAEAFVAWYADTGPRGAAAQGLDVGDDAPLVKAFQSDADLVAINEEDEIVWRYGMRESMMAQRAEDIKVGRTVIPLREEKKEKVVKKAGITEFTKAYFRAPVLRDGAVHVGFVPRKSREHGVESSPDDTSLVPITLGVPRLALLCLKRLHKMGIAVDEFNPAVALSQLQKHARGEGSVVTAPWTPPHSKCGPLDYAASVEDDHETWSRLFFNRATDYANSRQSTPLDGDAAILARDESWADRDGIPLEAMRAWTAGKIEANKVYDEEDQRINDEEFNKFQAANHSDKPKARDAPGYVPPAPTPVKLWGKTAQEVAVLLVVARRLAHRILFDWRSIDATRQALLDSDGADLDGADAVPSAVLDEHAHGGGTAVYDAAVAELQSDEDGCVIVDAREEFMAKLAELREGLDAGWATHRAELRRLDALIIVKRTSEEEMQSDPPAPGFCLLCGDSAAPGGAPLLPCGGCHQVAFCTKTCQAIAWKSGHRAACAALKAVRMDDMD